MAVNMARHCQIINPMLTHTLFEVFLQYLLARKNSIILNICSACRQCSGFYSKLLCLKIGALLCRERSLGEEPFIKETDTCWHFCQM